MLHQCTCVGLSISTDRNRIAGLQLIIRAFQVWLTMLRTNFFTRYFTMLVMFYQMLLPERRITNLLILFVHVGKTGRYHNELLDSLTIILLYGR